MARQWVSRPELPTIRAMGTMRLTLLHRLGALTAAIAMLGVLVALPAAAQPPAPPNPSDGNDILDAPTLSLADLGTDGPLRFYSGTGSATVRIPVPDGLLPAAINVTVNLPFNIRTGILTATQDDRLISKVGLPLTDGTPLVIPLAGVQVADGSVAVSLSLTTVPEEGFCLDWLHPVEFIDGSVSYTGIEVPPTTIADFLPPILRKLTIAVPSQPSQAESDAAVQLATAVVARYRSQNPDVVLVPLAAGATTVDGPSLPLERQIIVKEGPDEGLSIEPAGGVPELLISGRPDKLTNQTRLLTDGSLSMAVSAKAVASELHSSPWLPGDSTTLAQLGQPALSSVGLAPQVDIILDQTRFGHSAQGFRLHLVGSHTPVPGDYDGQLTAAIDGEVFDAWPTDPTGAIDHWVNVPDRLLQRYTTLGVSVNTGGNDGQCNAYWPTTLRIEGSSVVESTPANPPIPPGFRSMPQALMPRIQLGIGEDKFADTVRGMRIAVGLQRQSTVPLVTEVTSFKQALDSQDPAILISADGWSDTSITLPVSADGQSVTIKGPGDEETTLTLDPEIKFGSLQTVFDGQRSLLIATSNGASSQLDALLQWLDADSQRWSQLRGNAEVAIVGREPASVLWAHARECLRPIRLVCIAGEFGSKWSLRAQVVDRGWSNRHSRCPRHWRGGNEDARPAITVGP